MLWVNRQWVIDRVFGTCAGHRRVCVSYLRLSVVQVKEGGPEQGLSRSWATLGKC